MILLLALTITKREARPQIPSSLPTPTPIPLEIPEEALIPTPRIQSPPNVLINRLRDITFSYGQVSIPRKIKLFKSEPTPVDPVSAKKIASELSFAGEGLTRNTQAGQAVFWQQGTRQIIFYLESGNVEYSSPQTLTPKKDSTLDELIRSSIDFLKIFSTFSEGLAPDPSRVSWFLSGPGELKVAENFEEADIIDIPFVQRVDGLSIFYQFGSNARGHVWINKSNQVLKVSLRSTDRLVGQREEDTLTIDEAERKIIEGQGIIVFYGSPYHEETLPPPLKTDFSRAEVGYLKDNLNNLLYPVFVFEGNAFLEDREGKISVYLPALR